MANLGVCWDATDRRKDLVLDLPVKYDAGYFLVRSQVARESDGHSYCIECEG
jgi:hypothetical protein